MGLFLSSSCIANNIYESFPNEIKPNEKYVFYSHGFIVEGKNPTPINPRWGMYDFPEIKNLSQMIAIILLLIIAQKIQIQENLPKIN